MVQTPSKNYFRTPRSLMNLCERSQEMAVEKTLYGRIKDFFVKKICSQLMHICNCLRSLLRIEVKNNVWQFS